MGRIAISSGSSGGSFLRSEFKTQKRSFFGSSFLFFTKFFSRKRGNVEHIAAFLRETGIYRLVLAGDLQENTLKEQGLRLRRDVFVLQAMLDKLRNKSGVEIEITAGSYELGYSGLPFNSDPETGISEGSVENFLKVAGRDKIFHSFSFGGKKFILVPYLFVTKSREYWLEKLENEFVYHFCKEIEESKESVIIIAHDFDSLRDYRLKIPIRSFLKTGKIEKIFCGHNHARWQFVVDQNLIKMYCSLWFIPVFLVTIPFAMLGGFLLHGDWMLFVKVREYYISRKPMLELAEKFKPITIPAPNSIFGGGIIVYDTKTGEVSVEKI